MDIIKARVWTKIDTLEAWDANPLILGPGEFAPVLNTPGGSVFNFKVGTGDRRFSDLPWSLQTPGTAQEATPSTVFPLGTPGLYIPTENGTYNGITVDLSAGYTQLIWDGSTLVKVEFPINLSGYVATSDIEQDYDVDTEKVLSGQAIGKGIKNDFSGGDERIASATTVKTLNDRTDFIDRPDLHNKHYLLHNDNSIIDILLTENSDSEKLLPTGMGLDFVDRPDLGNVIMVDKDGYIVSVDGQSTPSGGGSLELPVWNPPVQSEGFTIPVAGNDTIIGDYSALVSAYDAIMVTANVNPNIDPYMTKESIGTSKVEGRTIWKYSLKPVSPKLKILLIGGTHANEKMYIWAIHLFIKELVENWESHPFLEFLRWNVQIDVLPCRSPYTLANSIRARGFRVIPETDPVPFSWTKSGTTVTLLFNVGDFPDDGYLSGTNYFSAMPASALQGRTSFGVITSSDETAVPLNAYRIGTVISGNSISFTAPAGGGTSGTGTFQVWTDPNRNFTYADSDANWEAYVGQNTIQPNDAGNVIGLFDNKGTRPFSLVENRHFVNLIQSQHYGWILDGHADAAANDLRYVVDSGLVPRIEKIKSESAAFNSDTFNILDYTDSTQPNPTAIVPRRYGVNFHTIEWDPGLYSASATAVRDGLRWLGIVVKDAVTQLVNKK